MLATGVEPDSEFAVKGPFLNMVAGDVLASGAKQADVMLGEGLAKSLKAKPGSSLTLLASTTDGALNALDVTVKGVFSTGVPDIDKRLVYTDITTAQKLLNTTRVSTLGVFLKSMEATGPAQQRVARAHRQLTVQTWLDQAFFYKSVRDLYNRIFGALGLIIGVIVVFVVTNAMAMAIIERTREIGTLRALGTLPSQLLRTLALEGMVLGGVGAAAGALIAFAVSMLLYVVPVQMPPPPGSSRGYPLNVTVDAGMYAATMLAMVVLAMLASAWIARRTVHTPVVDALAHT
jgi:putative ABC transport system permease protein